MLATKEATSSGYRSPRGEDGRAKKKEEQIFFRLEFACQFDSIPRRPRSLPDNDCRHGIRGVAIAEVLLLNLPIITQWDPAFTQTQRDAGSDMLRRFGVSSRRDRARSQLLMSDGSNRTC